MSENQDMGTDDDMEIELPPAVMQLLHLLAQDQRKLLKDKNVYKDPDQLRKFLATTLMERLSQVVKMFGATLYDLHGLAVSNSTQLQHMRRWSATHFRKLGVEVNDGEPFAGVGTEQIDAAAQALYALGSYLQATYPDDKAVEEKYNAMASALNELISALMGNQSVDEEDEEDEEDEDPDDDEELDAEDPADDEPAGDAETTESPTDE